MQGSVRALKAAPKLHNYNSTRNKNSDTQMTMMMKDDLCQKWRVKLIFQGT